jgi:hypothetical protein
VRGSAGAAHDFAAGQENGAGIPAAQVFMQTPTGDWGGRGKYREQPLKSSGNLLCASIKSSSGSLFDFAFRVAVCGFAISFGLFSKAHPSSSNLDHRGFGVDVLHNTCQFETSLRIAAIMIRIHRFDPYPTSLDQNANEA